MGRYFAEIKTTGLSFVDHQIVELSILPWEGGERRVFLAKPSRAISPEALDVEGWSIQTFDSFPDRKEGLFQLASYLSEEIGKGESIEWIVYSGEFFQGFWQALCEEVLILFPSSLEEIPSIYILSIMDAMRGNAERLPSLENYKKQTVAKIFLSHPYGSIEDLRQITLFIIQRGVSLFPASLPPTLLEGLNSSQQRAVLHTGTPLLILAGAGSGKTRVIITKILYFIRVLRIRPETILAVTFTNKAAKEMLDRLEVHLSKSEVRALSICTFHSLGLRILKEEHAVLGYSKEFSIFGDSEKEGVLREVLLELNIPEDVFSLANAQRLMSRKKNHLDRGQVQATNALEDQIFQLYEKRLAQSQGWDFDDLIQKPIFLMTTYPEIRAKWSQVFQAILVDEYQDTNEAQFQMLQALFREQTHLCVVGDDDQSIYAFRGANVGNILSFQDKFPSAQKILLDHNYRNAPHILQASLSIVGNNPGRYDKPIKSGRLDSTATTIPYYEAEDAGKEAEWIAEEIFAHRLDHRVSYEEQAILCRTNMQMRDLEKALREKGIPYRVIGGFSFYDRAEVKTILAYLRLLYNQKDNQAFFRAVTFPKRGVGEKTLFLLSQYAISKDMGSLGACVYAEQIDGINQKSCQALMDFSNTYWDIRHALEFSESSLSSILEDLYVQMGIQEGIYRVYPDTAEKRLWALEEILGDIRKRENRKKIVAGWGYELLGQYLQDTILAQTKEEEEQQDKVSMITIHSAKGLEFRTVFLPGFQEGTFPHERALNEGEQGLIEERRLCYVAMTRAKDFLYLTMYKEKLRGKDHMITLSPSRFLDEIPDNILEIVPDTISKEDEIEYLRKMREILKMKD